MLLHSARKKTSFLSICWVMLLIVALPVAVDAQPPFASIVSTLGGESSDSSEEQSTSMQDQGPSVKPTNQDKPKLKRLIPGSRKRVKFADPKEIKTVEQTILKGWENIKSLSAKMTSKQDKRTGVKHRRTGEGTIDLKIVDGVTLIRYENFDTIWADVNDESVFTGERITKIYDGKFLYTTQELHKGKYAFKADYRKGALPALGGPDLLKQLEGAKRLRLETEFDMDGKIVYRLSGNSQPFAYKLAIDKKTGFLLKSWIRNAATVTSSEIEFSGFVINPEFPEDHFTFTPPEGVEILDTTVPATLVAPPSSNTDSTSEPQEKQDGQKKDER